MQPRPRRRALLDETEHHDRQADDGRERDGDPLDPAPARPVAAHIVHGVASSDDRSTGALARPTWAAAGRCRGAAMKNHGFLAARQTTTSLGVVPGAACCAVRWGAARSGSLWQGTKGAALPRKKMSRRSASRR